MIQAADFVEAARRRGFQRYAGVPCSFLKPFINYVIEDESLSYVSVANEGDAVAFAAGTVMGGARAVAMLQNSGLGNAVSPLTSLNWVFRIPVLVIVTWRGMPGIKDEPQHELMGRIMMDLLDTMEIPHEIFPESADAVSAVLDRACRSMDETGRPYALVMKKGTVEPHVLENESAFESRPAGQVIRRERGRLVSRTDALRHVRAVADRCERPALIGTTGFTGRELYALGDREDQLYMVGSMGCASSFGLGLSLECNDHRVFVVDGDGAALMRMGNIATVGAYGRRNLVHVILDNGVHDSTGGQKTVSERVSFAEIANACGYAWTAEGDDPALIDAAVDSAADGPRLVHLRIEPGAPANLPRPSLKPPQVRERFQQYLQKENKS